MSPLRKIGRSEISALGTRIVMNCLSPSFSTTTSRSRKMFKLTLLRLLTVSQNALTKPWTFRTPSILMDLSDCSTAPRTITPPSVFAKAQYVSQMLFGRPPAAAFASRLQSSPRRSFSKSSRFIAYSHRASTPQLLHAVDFLALELVENDVELSAAGEFRDKRVGCVLAELGDSLLRPRRELGVRRVLLRGL